MPLMLRKDRRPFGKREKFMLSRNKVAVRPVREDEEVVIVAESLGLRPLMTDTGKDHAIRAREFLAGMVDCPVEESVLLRLEGLREDV